MRYWFSRVLLLLWCVPTMLWAQSWTLASPDGQIRVTLEQTDTGLTYQVAYRDVPLLRPSALGLQFADAAPLQAIAKVVNVSRQQQDSQWQPVWGQRANIRDHYQELTLDVQGPAPTAAKWSVIFRAYDDGVAFRYRVPKQAGFSPSVLQQELTRFEFAHNDQSWWLPVRELSYEYPYLKSALSGMDHSHTPLVVVGRAYALAVHEAALVDYAAMTLKQASPNVLSFSADLIPWSNGDKVRLQLPLQTPWRTLQIGPNELALLNSSMILNLNEPMAPNTDVSYIKPGKYMGIWWEMHIGEKDWSPGPKQGATTERAKQYIDFASRHQIDSVLIEGWNQGWEGEWWHRPPTFSFTESVRGFSMPEVASYAKQKGVQIIGHHETAAGVSYYEQRLNDAYSFLQKLGIHSIKTGYVGPLLDGKEWHDGQFMVRHQQHVTELAAKHQLMVNAHETVKDTGLSRTYPNLMSRESVRGMEYNGGSPDTGNAVDHTVIIPFTRGLAGPIDFTPGIFNFNYQAKRPVNRVPSTLANQLALYVTLYSPLQMAADLPENYEGHPAFAFIQAVPTDWQQSIALQGKIGQFLVMARQAKASADWYVGATTNEEPRQVTLKFDFLQPSRVYQLTAYLDGDDADWQTKPMSYRIERRQVTAADHITLSLQAGGGAALQLQALDRP